MKENLVLARVRLAASQLGMILFRNNSGALQDARGTWVRFGVANPGGSDLIGFTEHVIRPHDVGRRIAVFTALETKSERGRLTDHQENFLAKVRASGGISGVVRSESDASEILRRWRMGEP